MTLTPPQAPTSTTELSEPVSEIEIFHSNLIPDVELMQIVMKSCSHMNFATKFSVRLFEEETQLTHNVAGQGNPKLDPKIISFTKAKCFELSCSHVVLLRMWLLSRPVV